MSHVNRINEKTAGERARDEDVEKMIRKAEKMIDEQAEQARKAGKKFVHPKITLTKTILTATEANNLYGYVKAHIEGIKDITVFVTINMPMEDGGTHTGTLGNLPGTTVEKKTNAVKTQVKDVVSDQKEQEAERQAMNDKDTNFDLDSIGASLLNDDDSQVATIPHLVIPDIDAATQPEIPLPNAKPQASKPGPSSASHPVMKKIGNAALREVMKQAGEAAAPPRPTEKKSIWARLFGSKKKTDAKKKKK